MTITPGDTLIILDEIQNALKAFESLKYFCEDAPEYHVMAAGSLSGVALHKGVSYPVGAIITQYRGDFGKHASAKELPKINMVWDSIPMQLAKENRKFFFGKMKKGARSGDFEVAIQWLVDSGLLQIGMNAVPVEVKAETNVRSQSLKAFYDKFHPEKSIRFSLLPYKDQDWMVNIPLYSVCNL